MWTLSKKLNQGRLPIDGPWSVTEGQNDGRVMIVRRNNGYREFGRVAGYEHQAGIAVPLRSPEPTGLPSPEANIKLDAIEDAICDSLQEQAESLLVAIITTSRMREFVFYTRAPEQLQLRFEHLRSQITSHEIQLMIQMDKTWEVYQQVN